MNFLEKIRQKPEKTRKVIFWVIIIVVGSGLFLFWLIISYQQLKFFPKDKFIKELNISNLNKEIDKIPKKADFFQKKQSKNN